MVSSLSGWETKAASEHRGRHDCISFLSWRPKGNVFIGKKYWYFCANAPLMVGVLLSLLPLITSGEHCYMWQMGFRLLLLVQQQNHYEDVQLMFTDLKGPVEEITEPGAHPWFRLVEKHSGASLQKHQNFIEMLELILAIKNVTTLFQLPHNCKTHTHSIGPFFCQYFQFKCHWLGLLKIRRKRKIDLRQVITDSSILVRWCECWHWS